jgi:ankyrin repeat protein
MALGIKVMVALFALGVMGMGYIIAQVWFNPIATDKDIAEAIEKATDVNERNAFGYTGLMYAAGNGKLQMARLLIAKGAKINLQSTNEGDTALHLACYNGDFNDQTQIAQLLIAYGAEVNLPNKDGQRPIHYILQIEDLEARFRLLRLLLLAGADINVQNNDGNTMLHLSVELHDRYWIDMLRKYLGSALSLNIKNKRGQTPIERARELGFTGPDSVEEALLSTPPSNPGGSS